MQGGRLGCIGSMVSFALGLYVVTAQHGSLIDDGPRNVFTVYWGPEEHFLALGELWESTSSMGLVELVLCAICGRRGSLSLSPYSLLG